MQMCPNCDKVYDESEYPSCPYCSGELEYIKIEEKIKHCHNCDSYMVWESDCWVCVNCGNEDYSSEDDYDSIMEH